MSDLNVIDLDKNIREGLKLLEYAAEFIRCLKADHQEEVASLRAELEAEKQMNADAVAIADSAARSDIECNCEWESTDNVGWHDTKNVCINPDEPVDFLKRAVRYLTARYLIERKVGDEHLVRFK